MGREVRRVPANWKHPQDERGNYTPLFDGAAYQRRVTEWDTENAKWLEGFRSDYSGGWKPIEEKYQGMSYSEWAGSRPIQSDYMPDWPDAEKTHLMMYETCTEGTPISPAFTTAEELAQWLADNGTSAFGRMTATYEQWLGTIGVGSTFSALFDGQEVKSGVAVAGEAEFQRAHNWPDVVE